MELFGAKLQYEAAMKYYKGSGQGYTRNRRKAFKLFQEAAEAGLVDAMVMLSDMYFKGEGCQRNEKEGLKWLEEAASNGNAEAQYKIGLIYIQKTHKWHGCEWLEKAATQGYVKAMLELGEQYIRFDNNKAIHWLSQPALIYNPRAIYLLAEACEEQEKKELEKNLLDEIYDDFGELISPKFDEIKWIEHKQEEIENYQPSKKVKSLYKKALQLYEQEASFGNWECVLEVANMYLHGIGTEIDYQVAFQYYYHLANQPKGDNKGNDKEFYRESAIIKLAKMYELGLGCEQSISKCEELMNQLNIDKEWFKNMVL